MTPNFLLSNCNQHDKMQIYAKTLKKFCEGGSEPPYRVVIITHQTVSLEKYWKLFSATLSVNVSLAIYSHRWPASRIFFHICHQEPMGSSWCRIVPSRLKIFHLVNHLRVVAFTRNVIWFPCGLHAAGNIFTVLPNRWYREVLCPTTLATTSPECALFLNWRKN